MAALLSHSRLPGFPASLQLACCVLLCIKKHIVAHICTHCTTKHDITSMYLQTSCSLHGSSLGDVASHKKETSRLPSDFFPCWQLGECTKQPQGPLASVSLRVPCRKHLCAWLWEIALLIPKWLSHDYYVTLKKTLLSTPMPLCGQAPPLLRLGCEHSWHQTSQSNTFPLSMLQALAIAVPCLWTSLAADAGKTPLTKSW